MSDVKIDPEPLREAAIDACLLPGLPQEVAAEERERYGNIVDALTAHIVETVLQTLKAKGIGNG